MRIFSNYNCMIMAAMALLISATAYSQDKEASQDSVLDAQQQESEQLISIGDSIRKQDSIEQMVLMAEIEALKDRDRKKKAELQRRLDSVKLATELRDARIKKQVDSLRENTVGLPVVFNHDTLLFIYSKIGPYSPSDRSQSIQAKIKKIAEMPDFEPEGFKVIAGEESSDLFYDDIIVLSVTDRDAFWKDMTAEEMADSYRLEISEAIVTYIDNRGPLKTILRIGLIVLVVLIIFFMVRYLNKNFSRFVNMIAKKVGVYLKGIKIRNYEFLTAERELQLIVWMLNAFKWFIIILIMYLALPVIFSIFPTTESFANRLIGYVVNPVTSILKAFVGYIPELITIAVILGMAYYVVKFLRFLASEIENEKLKIPGFFPDWGKPTYNILRILVYAFSFIVIFPYLPGSDSPVFQGVSVFLGLLISLGSSSAISNIIAGLVITYMRPFKLGDRVKIGDVIGDVREKTMLVTRLRTIKNEDVTIPNSAVLSGQTTNFTSSASRLGLIIHSTVTIGYDVPWRNVHEALIDAALKTPLILKDPHPFVLQTSLDDFYVSYQVNAYTEESNKQAQIYSDLHQCIQDAFNETGIEILSPHYRAARDGNATTIPANYLPDDYVPPPFNVKMRGSEQTTQDKGKS